MSQLLPDDVAFKSSFVRTLSVVVKAVLLSSETCVRCSTESLLLVDKKHFSSFFSAFLFFLFVAFLVFQISADVIFVFVCVLRGKGSPDIC